MREIQITNDVSLTDANKDGIVKLSRPLKRIIIPLNRYGEIPNRFMTYRNKLNNIPVIHLIPKQRRSMTICAACHLLWRINWNVDHIRRCMIYCRLWMNLGHGWTKLLKTNVKLHKPVVGIIFFLKEKRVVGWQNFVHNQIKYSFETACHVLLPCFWFDWTFTTKTFDCYCGTQRTDADQFYHFIQNFHKHGIVLLETDSGWFDVVPVDLKRESLRDQMRCFDIE